MTMGIATGNLARRGRLVRPAVTAAWLVLVAVPLCATAADDTTVEGKYRGPCALAVSKDGTMLYAACADAREVAWVALPSGNVVRRICVPATPTGLALSPDGKKLAVACAAPRSSLAVLDAGSGAVLATIRIGHTAMAPTFDPDGRRIYVCNRFDNDVSVVDLPAGKEIARVRAVREPIAAAITPDGRTLLVANHLPDARTDVRFDVDVQPVITAVDTRTRSTTAIKLPHGANGVRGICVLPDGRHALVTHLLSNFESTPIRVEGGWINTNVVSIIDLRQRKVLHTLGMDMPGNGAGNPWDVVCTPDGRHVCVSLSGTHELCVIGTDDLLGDDAERMAPMMGVWPIYTGLGTSLWQRVKLPGKGPRGLAVAGSTVYVAEYFSDTLAAVDVERTAKQRDFDERYATDPTPAGGTSTAATSQLARQIVLGPPPRLTQRRLGELLFHDASICYQHWQSCASCHPDGRIDGLNWDLLNDGEGNPKNTKSLLLSHQTDPAMWEGVRETAKEAVRSGFENILFARRPEEESAAIDVYLQSLRPIPSPHLVGGQLSPSAVRGRELFHGDRGGCATCHPGPLYTDRKSHDVGTRGRYDRADRFDTPTLIEVWRTAPYLHDGRYTTMKELLGKGRHGQHRARGGPWTEEEIDDLAAFVLSL